MIVRRISPWGPWWSTPSADLAQVRQEMESLMERLVGAAPDGSAAGVFPPMNVSQDGEHYYVRALIPGVDASQLDVAVACGGLRKRKGLATTGGSGPRGPSAAASRSPRSSRVPGSRHGISTGS
jgi:hypothetical protein